MSLGTKKERSDIEKYDALATLDQIRHNLYMAVIEYIDEFGIAAFHGALNEALNEKGWEAVLTGLKETGQ